MHVLLALSAASKGSVHYRIDEPARAVRESGADVEVTVTLGIPTTVRNGEVVDADAGDFDVVVLQLPTLQEWTVRPKLLQAQGVAVVVEVDDLLAEREGWLGVDLDQLSHGVPARAGGADLGGGERRRVMTALEDVGIVGHRQPSMSARRAGSKRDTSPNVRTPAASSSLIGPTATLETRRTVSSP